MRNPLAELLIALTLLFGATGPHAARADHHQAAVDAASLFAQAQALHLPDTPYWHALMHYRPASASPGAAVKSGIISPEFFLAPDGAENPAAELAATLAAVLLPPGADANQHAQCRFPARYSWLRETLDWQEIEPPRVQCDNFREWSVDGRVESISLIYATGYLSNPASLYGHLLLKFNTPAPMAAGALLDPSLSYGALVPPGEGGIVYLYKGLLGGYDAGFSHEKFYRHNHSYAEKELRDLWEYKLALSRRETAQLVAHSWELLRVKFHYYFFSENCASALAELLRLVVDEPLLPDTPWAIPSTVFDKLATLQHDGEPLVAEVRRIPSRQNRFYAKYFALTAEEQRAVKQFVDRTRFDGESYRQLSLPQQTRVVETLIDFYQFLAAAQVEPKNFQPIKQVLLAERLHLPAGEPQWPAETLPAPHESQTPMLLQVGAVTTRPGGGAIELRIRPAYYDFLALDTGRVPYSSLAMFDLRARIDNERLHFRSLGLVEVETLNLSRTGLPGDGGNAWRLKLGFEPQNLSCASCTVFAIDGGIGRARPVAEKVVAYVMLDGRAQSSAEESGTLAATARIGLTLNPTGNWRTRLDAGSRSYINGSRSTESIIRWENRFGNSRDWDIRLSYEKHVAREVTAAVALYW